jgi:hypothetical protein
VAKTIVEQLSVALQWEDETIVHMSCCAVVLAIAVWVWPSGVQLSFFVFFVFFKLVRFSYL